MKNHPYTKLLLEFTFLWILLNFGLLFHSSTVEQQTKVHQDLITKSVRNIAKCIILDSLIFSGMRFGLVTNYHRNRGPVYHLFLIWLANPPCAMGDQTVMQMNLIKDYTPETPGANWWHLIARINLAVTPKFELFPVKSIWFCNSNFMQYQTCIY